MKFLPSESHPIGGFEFQAVLILIMLYLVFTGNSGLAEGRQPNIQAA